jgi:hypothetical protein
VHVVRGDQTRLDRRHDDEDRDPVDR